MPAFKIWYILNVADFMVSPWLSPLYKSGVTLSNSFWNDKGECTRVPVNRPVFESVGTCTL